MNSYIEITNGHIENIKTADVFSGEFIQDNVRLGSKPQSIRVGLDVILNFLFLYLA